MYKFIIPRILKFEEQKTSNTLLILYNYKTLSKKNKRGIQRHKNDRKNDLHENLDKNKDRKP